MQSEKNSYTTLKAEVVHTAEYVEKRSRFIAALTQVTTPEQAQAFIDSVRVQHYDARHHVYAYRLSDGFCKASDDGEPQRTAGFPTLDVLKGQDLQDVCCVVTRYFGGTLLGPGGLVRAYTTATQRACEAARTAGDLQIMGLCVYVRYQVSYALYERVARMATDAGASQVDAQFAADVEVTFLFEAGRQAAFLQTLEDLFAGEKPYEVSDPVFVARSV